MALKTPALNPRVFLKLQAIDFVASKQYQRELWLRTLNFNMRVEEFSPNIPEK